MKNNLFLLFFLQLFLFSGISFSQIAEKGIPDSFDKKKIYKTNYVILNAPDVSNIKNSKGKSFQFAKKIVVDINIKEDKFIYTQNSSKTVWQVGISAKKALSLNLTLSDFEIPKGAKLFVFSANKKTVLGAFTHKNNKKSRILPILPIHSDSIVLEYSEPINVKFESKLKVSSVGYGFVDISENSLLKSGSCNIDIRCSTGLPWYVEKRAVAKMYIDNESLCTGSLINNTNNDETPYFLTANHCVATESSANNTVFYFNYEHTVCNGLEIDDVHTLSGSNMVATPATETQLDFALLKLSVAVPDKYIPYYAGWNISTTPPNSATSIHHPAGDVKKISFTNTALQSDTYSGYIANTHWKVSSWDLGTTEGGSSGGPLFNENHQIIGDLTGGYASCTATDEWDKFAKISSSWDYFSETNRQLKHWLNPDNLSITELDGFEPFSLSDENDAEIVEVLPKGNFCPGELFTPTVLIRNLSTLNLTSLTVKYEIADKLIETKQWTGNLASHETAKIEFTSISKPLGNYNLKAIIENPNGETDVNTENDTKTNLFDIIDGYKYQFLLTTDNYGDETSWELLNGEGEVIYSGGPYANNTNYTYDLCLDASCFSFVIKDDAADGICCKYGSGNYKMLNENNNLVFEIGENFTNLETHAFCTEQNSINTINSYKIKLRPNPVIEHLIVEIEEFTNFNYEIYSLMGTKLSEGKLNINENKISFNTYNSGIYIVKIYNNELKQYYKIFKN